jgi:tetratricopeptide (TPR) repeat protein
VSCRGTRTGSESILALPLGSLPLGSLLFGSLLFGLLLPLTSCGGASSARPGPASPERVQGLEETQSDQDARQLGEAEREIEAGRYESALQKLRGLVARNSGNARLAVLMRRACTSLPAEQRGAQVAEIYKTYRQLERDRRQDGKRSAGLAFGVALFAPNEDEQLDWLRRAVGRDDKHYFALTKLGERLWRMGELNRSRELLERAVSLQRNLPEAWLILAAVEQDSGRTKNAAQYYDNYLSLRPLDRDVSLRYVRLLLHDLGRPDAARPILESLEKADPSNLEVGLDIAAMHWLLGEHDQAEARYRQLLQRHPDDIRVFVNLGNLYFQELDRPVQALQVYRYLGRLPTEARMSTVGAQLLFVPERIRRLEAQLGDKAPPPPESWRELL